MATFNPKLPDDSVNSTQRSPIKDLTLLLGAIASAVVIVLIVVGLALDLLIPYIPTSVEEKIFAPLLSAFALSVNEEQDGELGARRQMQQEKLEELLEGLVKQWPEAPYNFNVKIADFGGVQGGAALPNAAALPGGCILVTPALLDGAGSENELAMVLAHELGHFKNRDHLRGLGKGLAVALVVAAMSTSAGAKSVAGIAEFAGSLTTRSFGREQENEADEFGLGLVANYYGHVGGATGFFERMLKHDHGQEGVKLYFRTHPLSKARIESIKLLAKKRGWKFSQDLKLLPWSVFPALDGAAESDLRAPE